MSDFIERIAFGEVHNEDISLLTIIQISSHVVDELYKLSFARSKFAKAMLEGEWYVILFYQHVT
jgi:c-di-GMP-related signal transduction protein